MIRSLKNNDPFRTDPNPILKKLGISENASETTGDPPQPQDEPSAPAADISQEDLETLRDFVIESLDSLGKIEIHLLDLEQDPQNPEPIHTILRAFHTVKGVSGFLNLKNINQLSHATENLLDCAREGEIRITDAVIDVILESVDILKQLINCVELALAAGNPHFDADMDLTPHIKKLERILKESRKDNKRIGEMLIEDGALDEEDLEKGLEKQKTIPGQKIGRILVDEKMAASKDVIKALRDQRKGTRLSDFQVKVDAAKLDGLVDLTGELVISQTMLRQSRGLQSINDQQLNQNLSRLTQIVSSLQKTAMSLRMIPIKSTFQKMVRLVRDLSKSSGKTIALEMSGEETEIDRNLVEELYEPLVHMVRNAVDHGIEMPEERRNAGKPEQGVIRLRAYHAGENIVIEIIDDGRGIDPEKILQKALTTGLIEKDHVFSETDIFNLIFHPGFSTAKAVTDISGRGVGMDVVKKRIEKLRGRLRIQSAVGKGSQVIITLPLTLAIIDGMIVRAGDERYIIPTLSIVESFQPEKEKCHTVQGKGELVQVRGSLIPLLRLERMFGVKGNRSAPWEGLVVVVENNGQKGGLLLDELLRQEEIVIKSLGETLKGIQGIAGGAILGDGKIGLILDIAGLLEMTRIAA
jgi:two-component system chemotaxis sensor kinase CheA